MTLFRHRVSGPGSAGDVWVSTLHSTGAASLAEAHNAWFSFLNSAISNHLVGWWVPATSARTAITDQLDELTGKNVAQKTSALNIIGSDTGSATSPRDCVVVGLRTDLPTRAGRGRMYLPGPSGDHYTATGRFIQAEMGMIAQDFAGEIERMSAVVQPVIYHRAERTTTPITRVTVGDIPGVQRRRTNKDTVNYSAAAVL
jgi:hypothetical protein